MESTKWLLNTQLRFPGRNIYLQDLAIQFFLVRLGMDRPRRPRDSILVRLDRYQSQNLPEILEFSSLQEAVWSIQSRNGILIWNMLISCFVVISISAAGGLFRDVTKMVFISAPTTRRREVSSNRRSDLRGLFSRRKERGGSFCFEGVVGHCGLRRSLGRCRQGGGAVGASFY